MRSLAPGVIWIACWMSPSFAGNDPVREAELQTRMLVSKVTANSRDEQFQRITQHRRFEVKFNKLAQAVASFAKEYNKNQGAVWPRAEAEKLRKALRELESAEKSLQ